MRKKVKKYIIPGTALIASFYISLLFSVGTLIGYLGTKIFHKKFVDTGKVEPFTIDLGKWEIHIHHWITGTALMPFICFMDFTSPLPIFWIGTLGGLIFHDLYTDKEWYKVIYRKENRES